MKIGLCLSGGGAKGSYQAGVIKALNERGISKFHSISGTSIGAINGYFIFTENVENLEKMWINLESNGENDTKIVDNTVDNSEVIENLSIIKDNSNKKINFYVNYVEVENSIMKEKVENLCNLDKDEVLNRIKYSSLLPFNPNYTGSVSEQFKKDLKEGLYNGYKLDGGLLRNTLIQPLIEDNVDKIIIISTRYDYNLPRDIKGQYDENNIIIVRPKTIFSRKDTLRFENEFCNELFEEGYEIGKNIEININKSM